MRNAARSKRVRSARLPIAMLPIRFQVPSARAPSIVAILNIERAGTRSLQRLDSERSAISVSSVVRLLHRRLAPSATDTTAVDHSFTRSIPTPIGFEEGHCATEFPGARRISIRVV